jgi:hypothetical protein
MANRRDLSLNPSINNILNNPNYDPQVWSLISRSYTPANIQPFMDILYQLQDFRIIDHYPGEDGGYIVTTTVIDDLFVDVIMQLVPTLDGVGIDDRDPQGDVLMWIFAEN